MKRFFEKLDHGCYQLGAAVLRPLASLWRLRPRKIGINQLGKRKVLILALTVLVFFGPLAVLLSRKPKAVEAGWWNDMWHYRKPITVSSGSAATTDFQILVDDYDTSTDITNGKMQADCGDIRFTSSAGVILPYWIEEDTCDTATTDIWVKVDSIPASGGTTIYMYYGYSSAEDGESGGDTFEFFDDFEDNSISSDWTQHAGGGSISETSGRMRLYCPSGGGCNWYEGATEDGVYVHTSKPLSGNIIFEADIASFNKPNESVGGTTEVTDDDNASFWGPYALADSSAGVALSGVDGDVFDDSTGVSVGSTASTGRLKVEITSTTSSEYFFDDTSGGSDSPWSDESDLGVFLKTWGSAGAATIDFEWFFVRKLLATEPSASVGSEEQGTSPLAYWSFDEGYGTTTHNQMEKNGENGLVSWWKLDEGTGSTAYDEMEINDGSLGTGGSAPSWTTSGKIGNALVFDGTDDYVDAGTATQLDGATAFTISMWVETDLSSFAGYDGILGRGSTGQRTPWIYGQNGASTITIQFETTTGGAGDGSLTTSGALLQDAWYHLVFTWDGTTVKAYNSGIQDSNTDTTTGGILASTDASLLIGKIAYDANSLWDGTIDHVKIYNRAFSADEVEAEYNSLQGHMINMDASTDWVDGAQPNPNQKYLGKALDFDGTNDYLDVSDVKTVEDVQSVSFWINPDSTTESIIDLDGGTHYIHLSSGTITATGFSSPTIYVNGLSGSTVAADVWSHVVVTTATSFDADDITIGKQSTNYFDGEIDEIKLYDSALTADEVKVQYNRDSGEAMGVGQVANPGSGPVGFWKFDEGSSYTAFDSSGNNNTGVLTNMDPATDWVQGKVGKALEFDGSDDYVDTDSIVSDLSSDTAGTWTAWINMDDSSNGETIIGFGDTDASEFIRFRNNSGELYAHVKDDGVDQWTLATDSTNFVSDTWYHVALVQDGTSPVLYVNGVAPDQTFSVSTDKTSWFNDLTGLDNGRIGKLSQNSEEYPANFTGKIDHVKVYDYARSPEQIHRDMATGSPIAYWSFNEGYGTTVHNQEEKNGEYKLISWWKFDDASSGASPEPQDEMEIYDGTWNANAVYTSTAKMGNGADFPGGGGDGVFLLTGAQAATYQTDDDSFSLSLWFKADANSGGDSAARITSRDCSDYFCLCMDQSGGTGLTHAYSDTEDSGAQAFSDQTDWHHSVSVWDQENNDFYWYLDGALFFSDTSLTAFNTSTRPIVLGGNTEADGDISGNEFDGKIDSVKIYSRALTASEVEAEYNSLQGHMINMDASTDWVDGARPNLNQKPLGKALDFDDSNDYVTVPDHDDLDFSDTDDLSISAWVKRDTFTTDDVILAKHITGLGYLLKIQDDDTVYFEASDSNDYFSLASSLTITDSNWYHIIAVFDQDSSTNSTLYLNGLEDPSVTKTGTIGDVDDLSNSDDLNLGKHSTDYFDGQLDEIKLYDYALIADEAKVEYNRGYGLVLGAGASDSDPNISSPAGWWKLDEGSSYTAFDSSGNGNTGELTNMDPATDWVQGKLGRALDFDGSNDYTDIGDVLDMATSDLSIVAWIKTSSSSLSHIVSKNYSVDPGYDFKLQADGTIQMTFLSSGSVNSVSSSTVDDDTWHHVAAVWDRSGNQYLYIDGVLEDVDDISSYSSDNISSTDLLILGACCDSSYNCNYYLDGEIDNVKIYQTVLSHDQVAWEYNQGKPMAHWRFDEGQGTTTYDESDNDLDGTFDTNAPEWTESGKHNDGIDFEATNSDHIDIGDLLGGDFPQLTVSAWVNPESVSSTDWFVGEGGAFRVGLTSTDEVICWHRGWNSSDVDTNDSTTSTTSPINDLGSWYHIACVFDGDSGDRKIYVNGVLETDGSTSVVTTKDSIDNNAATIGDGYNNAGYYFDGILDEVKVYNYALTADQLKVDYNNSAALRYD